MKTYGGYGITEMRTLAREYKIAGRSKMSGDELLTSLRAYWDAKRQVEERRVLVIEQTVLSEPFMMHHTLIIRRWTITIPSAPSYRCVIQECPCGLRDQIGITYVRVDSTAEDFLTRKREIEDIRSVPRVECLCTARTCRLGAKAHTCHGWHRARIDQLIASIEKMPKKHRISTSMHSYPGVSK